MAIGKPRGKLGMRPVYVYDQRQGKKVYVGSRKNLRGEDGARDLERAKTKEFAREPLPDTGLTISAYADEWLDLHHGTGTRRPAPATYGLNEGNLRPFVRDFGHRPLDGGVTRREALKWAKQHPHNAKTVSAMFNDALDDDVCKSGNPFANRRHEAQRGRKDIHPLTEEEVTRLADVALEHWGEETYGLVARAWVLFGAWVGCRPGETFKVELADMDFVAGEVRITRVKKRGKRYPTDTVVLPRLVVDAIRAMPAIPVSGPIFPTLTGRRMVKGSLRYHWDPIRVTFRKTVTAERWGELLRGTEDGRSLDFYALRHACASQIVARGGNEYDVSAQLGNSPQVARETYIHSYVDAANDRNRRFLDGAEVTDLEAARIRRMGS